MAKVKVRIELLDGRKFEGTTATYMCVSDRYRLEEKFGAGAGELMKAESQFDDEGKPLPDADLSGFSEEWVGYLTYLALGRIHPAIMTTSWEELRVNIVEIVFDKVSKEDEADAADPTLPPSPEPE